MNLKRILRIISIILVLSIISIFTYLFIDSKLYKLECSRINDGEYETYYFKYNMLNKITSTTYKTVERFSTEQEAKDYYNNEVDHGIHVEINGNNLEYFYNIKDHIGEKINVIEAMYTDFVYECKKVKK